MYYFFYKNAILTDPNNPPQPFSFNPFSRGGETNTSVPKYASSTEVVKTNTQNDTPVKMPKLRQLSSTPVGGMSASTTMIRSLTLASTTYEATIVRFIDRGTGHIYQANDINLGINKITNTTLPKIYESYWNKNSNTLILRYLKENTDKITNFYAEIRSVGSSTASTTNISEIKGKYLSSDIKEIAVSPAGDKIFTWNIENDNGNGYISSFDEKNKVKIVDSPLTQVNIAWPEASTVTFTTKGNSQTAGYAYSANTKTGEIKKLLGGVPGLSVKLSADAKKLLYSIGGEKLSMGVLNIKDGSSKAMIFSTLADKCIWSTLRKNELYCSVPTEIPTAAYPEDWYKGTLSFVDQIWHIDTDTGEVHLLANLLTLSNQLIDAQELSLDSKENFLYFMNKRNLSLWSLDLNQ